MNDIIRENGKTAAVCAGGAFLLSLLVGLITRNPFGVVLLRAFLLAVLFAGLGGGARIMIKKYLPDLLSGAADSAGARQAEEGRGFRVNIVLPEESGVSGSAADEREVPPDREGAAESDSDLAGAEEPTSSEEAQALSELTGELAAEESAGYRSADAERQSSGAGPRGETPEELAEYEPMDEGEAVGMEHVGLGAESSSLDSLPDISGLETAEEQPAPSPRTSLRASRGGAETPADAMKGALSGQDPATLAKAIRTVLKKDEKG